MFKKFFLFSLFFSLVLGLLYFLHFYVVQEFFPDKKLFLIRFSYAFNFIITYIVTSMIVLGSKKWEDRLSYLFFAGGIVKIILFVVFVKAIPLDIDRSNFLDFFVPYLACLLVEIFYALRILNRINPNKNGQ